MITEYGVAVVRNIFIAVIVLLICALLFFEPGLAQYSVIGGLGGFLMLVLFFFRDPNRVTPVIDNCVIAPADGKVIQISDVVENDFLKDQCVQVSIFMSPLNVHVNRFPITGTVSYFKYIPGKHLVAFDEKSSERNERTLIGIADGEQKLLFKQIAGAVARRIVANVHLEQDVTKGERFGMIRFGSRVDVMMPKNFHLNVQLHDKVKGGETIIAYYPSAPLNKGMLR